MQDEKTQEAPVDMVMNCATGILITIDEAHTLAADPPHLKSDDAPCFSCGATWRSMNHGCAPRSLSHSSDCLYWILLLRGDLDG